MPQRGFTYTPEQLAAIRAKKAEFKRLRKMGIDPYAEQKAKAAVKPQPPKPPSYASIVAQMQSRSDDLMEKALKWMAIERSSKAKDKQSQEQPI